MKRVKGKKGKRGEREGHQGDKCKRKGSQDDRKTTPFLPFFGERGGGGG
jgi:hypothetical protein